MIHKNLKGVERMDALNTSHEKVFLGNKCNSYIHTARDAKLNCTRNIYEKTVMKRKKKGFQRCV